MRSTKRKRVPSDHSSGRFASTSAIAFCSSVPGISPGRRPSLLVLTSPLPATLAGGLTPRFRRGFRIRVGTRGISSGFVAAFRHRRSPPDLLLPEPRRLPFGRPLGILRVSPKVPRSALRHHPGIEVSLAFSLDPAPFGLRFGVRAIPAVPARVFGFYPGGFTPQLELACASYPALFAQRIDPPSASPLPPRLFPRMSFTFPPFGLPAALARSFGTSHRVLSAHFYIHRSSAGSSRFLPASRPAASNRLFRTYCLRRELLSAFKISRNPAISFKLLLTFRQGFYT
jgi:hypothetical protein